jgi:hypothetical protein
MILLRNHLNFLDQWVKLLLPWSFLCDVCIYIYIYILSLKAIQVSISKLLENSFYSKSRGQRLSSGHCPLKPDNVRTSRSRGI